MEEHNSETMDLRLSASKISEEILELKKIKPAIADDKIENRIASIEYQLNVINKKLIEFDTVGINNSKIDKSKLSLSKWEYDVDENGNQFNISAGAMFITGYSSQEFAANKNLVHQIVVKSDKNTCDEHFLHCCSSNSAEQVTFKIITKSGAVRWILHTCFPIINNITNSNIRRVSNIDITDQKDWEEWLKLKSKVLEVAPIGIIITDADGKILWVNSAITKITGYTSVEIIGKNPRIFKSGVHEHAFYKKLWDTILSGKIWKSEIINKRKDGEEYFEEMTISPFLDNNGKATHFIAIKKDVTERKESEEQIQRYIEEIYENKDLVEQNAHELVELNVKLEQSEEKLQELNANKDRFFSIIAHDLKNPFTALIGYTEMMLSDISDFSQDEILEYVTTIHKTSKNVFSLLEGLLDWSRLQLGSFTLEPHPLDLTEIGNKVYDLYENSANQKEIKLINALENNVTLFADENAVFTTLRNLVSNAIKFTPHGGTIKYSSKVIENKFCKITIKDSGIGMDEKTLNKLFKIEVHHTTLGTNKEKGTGLGLLLCKDLVEKSGGKIWVESKTGQGSKFIFTVPLSK